MPVAEKVERNKDIVDKRRQGWSFRKIAGHFNINLRTAYDVYQRFKNKY